MIEVRNLTKRFGRVTAVDDVSFDVGAAGVVGFLGPNGAGKTTTLRILTGYLPATAGSARVAGLDVFGDSLAVREKVGYLPEHCPLPGEMRVREYLRFRGKLRGLRGRRLADAVDRASRRCWLSEPEDMTGRLIQTLSRGYRQRVGLADAMVHEPPVLILDEPTLGLDPNQIRRMRGLLRELGRSRTVLLSSHILGEVEQICTDVILIAAGRVVAAGPTDELAGAAVTAELRGAAPGELARAVEALPGVRGVQTAPAGRWTRLRIDAADDCREALAALVARRGWALRELHSHGGRLEELFVRMTWRQTTAEEPREADRA